MSSESTVDQPSDLQLHNEKSTQNNITTAISALKSGTAKLKSDICTKLKFNVSDFKNVSVLQMKERSAISKEVLSTHLLDIIKLSDDVCGIKSSADSIIINQCMSDYTNILNSNHKELIDLINDKLTNINTGIKTNQTNIEFINKSIKNVNNSIENIKSERLSSEIDTNFIDEINPAIVNPTYHIESNKPEYIDEECADKLTNFLHNQQFKPLHGRSVLNFGEVYTYTGSPKDDKYVPIPDVIKTVISKIESEHPGVRLNSCLINKYYKESFLPEHSDDEIRLNPQCPIFTLSIGSPRTVIFRDKTSGQETTIDTDHRSLYVMSAESQSLWSHRIDSSSSTPDNGSVRYSITFRDVEKCFTNSTVILGDSNTKYLTFGTGKGSFGKKLPGKRVETFRISHIEAKNCIGFHNVILHVGTNDLRHNSPHRPKDTPLPTDVQGHFSNLVSKISQIQHLSPKSNIIVSSILPTKDYNVNIRASEFNKLLIHYSVYVNPKIRIVQHDDFVLDSSLNPNLASYKNPNDKYHLGKLGIRLLANLFMSNILNRTIDKRAYASLLGGSTLGVSPKMSNSGVKYIDGEGNPASSS